MMRDTTSICHRCEGCLKFNLTPPTGMDKIGMDIMKHGGKSYLVIADKAIGYSWCKYLGKSTTSK